MGRDDRSLKEPSVFRAAWPAFAFFLSIAAVAAGFVALHHSLDDYRAPAMASGYTAARLQR